MEMESRSLQRREYSNLDRLEVIQHSNCLLVLCVIVAFVCFAVCLGIYMGTHGLMSGFLLYIFLIFLAAGLICLSVIGWQFYLIKREKDDEHKLTHAEIRLLNKTTTLVDDAIKHRDHVDLRRDDEKGVTDVKIIRAGVPMPGRAGVQRITEQQAPAISPPAPAQEDEKEEPIPIPTAPKFWDIVPLISTKQMPLCFIVDVNPNSPTYGQTVPAFGSILDLLSLCIIGRPGRGKSVLLLYYICCLAKHGAEMHVLDPQGAFKELMLLHGKQLPAMPPTARIYYYSNLQEMEFAVDNVLNDIKDREALYQPHIGQDGRLKVHTLKHPLVVLADELPIIAEMDIENKQRAKEENRARKEEGLEALKIRQVTSMVKTAVLAARKYSVYFIGASQSIDAGILPTRITSSFNSRIVFSTTEQKARQIGLEGADAKRFLPVIRRAGPGQTIYDCGRWDQPAVGAFPNMSIEDVLQFFGISMDELESLWIAELTAREQQQQQTAKNTGPLAGDTPPAIVQAVKKKRATLDDAVEVWNEFAAKGWEIGRPKLRQELQARGLECSDDLAKNLLNGIKQRMENGGASGGAGGTR